MKNGTTLNFNETNLVAGGVKISDGTSANNSFTIGAAISNQLTVQINNVNEKFSDYDFTDAQMTAFVGMKLEGDKDVTYRAIISYCAVVACCYARCNVDGHLELKWYDTTAFDEFNGYDGGYFDKTNQNSYQSGDALDGGNFTDYSSGSSADGGNFTEDLPYHNIYSLSSLEVSTEDVVITGIKVTASDGVTSAGKTLKGETYLCGSEGYVLAISANPLIEYGKAKEVAAFIGGKVVGMRFRPLKANVLGDPCWEAGDAAVITDRKNNSYQCYLTNLTYSIGSYTNLTCDAEPAKRKSADRYKQIAQIVADIKKESQQELDLYTQYVERMNQLAMNAMGYYETTETQDDGSTITYMHDKPLLKDSKIVYKRSIDGFFWSRDGGKTYTGGIDKNGNAVMNVIATIGLQADWINTGRFTAKDAKGVTKFLVDADTGQVEIRPDTFLLEGKTVTDISDAAAGKVTKELSASIKLNSESITAEVKRSQGQDVELAAAIKVAADSINLKVSKGDVSSQLSVESGAINIKSNRFSWSSTYSSLSSTGKLTCTGADISGALKTRNGNYFLNMQNAVLSGGYSGTTYGSIDFHGGYSNQSGYALRIKGDDINLMGRIYTTPNRNDQYVYKTAFKDLQFITNITPHSDGSFSYDTTTYSFYNGMLLGE